MQQSDENLKLIYQYIIDKSKIVNDKLLLAQWQKLKEFTPSLHEAAMKDEISLNNNGILVIKRFNAIKSKYHNAFIVPTCLRGAVLSYGRHSPSNHHFGRDPTQDNIEHYFWWPKMRNDIRSFESTCITCQFGKGSPQKRQEMRIRKLSNVGEHLMADFMGPFFKRYYILVLIDYGSGYTVIVPCDNCGAIVTADAILTNWVPYFGWFSIFESDLGC